MIFATSLLLALAACGDEPARPALLPLPALDTITLQADAEARGRGWDGGVEAVRQAALTAQTAGRVTAVNVDVGDRVVADEVLLRRLSAEEVA